MRIPRRLALASAVALGALAGLPAAAPAASAAPSQGGTTNVARQAAVRAWQAFQARAAARLHPHIAAAAQAPLAQTAPGAAFSKITNVKSISRDTLPPSTAEIEPDTQVEPDVAIDPGNPRVITAVFQQGRNGTFGGSADGGYATSQDGGRTWADGNFPLLTTVVGGPFQLASDFVAAFGPDGSDYIQAIPFDETDARSAVSVQRSTDGGISFGAPSLVVDDNNVNVFNDKNWIAVDNSPRSPHFGRIYSVWSRFILTGSGPSAVVHSPGAVSFSDDHGKTWSPIHFATSATADTEGLIPLIHPDGSVTVVYDLFVPSPTNPDQGNDFETAQTSHDGGVTWSAPVTVGQFLGSGVPGMRTGGLPSAAIDPVGGRMYVVWQDTRFNPTGLNDIVLSVSADGGRRWSAPRIVNPKVAGLDRFTPAVAADAGAVHVTYRTRGANGTAASVSEDYIASTDGGRTFGFEHKVGPPSVLKWAAVDNGSPPPRAFLGDYMGLAATPRKAELLWCLSSKPPLSGQFHQTAWGATVSR
jgi:BNR/Asp-box repeat